MTGYNDSINYNAAIPYNGGATPITATQSGVRRLAMRDLQNHPQVIWEKHKRQQNEEEMLLSLLAKMMDEFFDE